MINVSALVLLTFKWLRRADICSENDLIMSYICPYCGCGTVYPTEAMPYTTYPSKVCRFCGGLATWIPEYQKWYCFNCNHYT